MKYEFEYFLETINKLGKRPQNKEFLEDCRRIHCEKMTPDEFKKKYDRLNTEALTQPLSFNPDNV